MGAILYQDLVVDQGCTWGSPGDIGASITWASGATEATAVAVDLTSYTAAMKIRTIPGGTVLLSLTDTSGITLGGTAGTITIAITPTQATALPEGVHEYDLLLTSGAGVVTKFMSGSVRVNPTISV